MSSTLAAGNDALVAVSMRCTHMRVMLHESRSLHCLQALLRTARTIHAACCACSSASVPIFKRNLTLRMSNITRELKGGGRPPSLTIPELIPAVVNLSNAQAAVEGRGAATRQPMHALAFLPFLDVATARQLLVLVHNSAEGAGEEEEAPLEYDDSVRALLQGEQPASLERSPARPSGDAPASEDADQATDTQARRQHAARKLVKHCSRDHMQSAQLKHVNADNVKDVFAGARLAAIAYRLHADQTSS